MNQRNICWHLESILVLCVWCYPSRKYCPTLAQTKKSLSNTTACYMADMVQTTSSPSLTDPFKHFLCIYPFETAKTSEPTTFHEMYCQTEYTIRQTAEWWRRLQGSSRYSGKPLNKSLLFSDQNFYWFHVNLPIVGSPHLFKYGFSLCDMPYNVTLLRLGLTIIQKSIQNSSQWLGLTAST